MRESIQIMSTSFTKGASSLFLSERRIFLSSLPCLTKRSLARVGILLLYGWGAASAAAQSPSTYESTCRHIGVAGKTLFAECRRADGGYKQTNLPVAGVENLNGALHFTSMYQASTFQDSCKDIVVAVRTLSATCRRIDGGFARTSIPIPGIENVDGDLRYRH
jgi:CVNH domain